MYTFLSHSKFDHSNHRIGAYAGANQTVPYGTALLGGAVPGTSCQATIAPSLWDKSHPPIEGPHIKFSAYGGKPWTCFPSPGGQRLDLTHPRVQMSKLQGKARRLAQ